MADELVLRMSLLRAIGVPFWAALGDGEAGCPQSMFLFPRATSKLGH
jgi:hypothetical protein